MLKSITNPKFIKFVIAAFSIVAFFFIFLVLISERENTNDDKENEEVVSIKIIDQTTDEKTRYFIDTTGAKYIETDDYEMTEEEARDLFDVSNDEEVLFTTSGPASVKLLEDDRPEAVDVPYYGE